MTVPCFVNERLDTQYVVVVFVDTVVIIWPMAMSPDFNPRESLTTYVVKYTGFGF